MYKYKKRNLLFVTLNILATIIEYFSIYLLFTYIYKSIVGIIVSCSLLVINTIFSYLIYVKPLKLKEEKIDNVDNYKKLIEPLINKVESDFPKGINIRYIAIDERPNQAWCLGNDLYINTKYAESDDSLLGVCGHELGHLYSGLTHHMFWFCLRVSSILSMILSAILRVFTYFMTNKKRSWLWIFYIAIYIPFIITSLINQLIVYPFLRGDEHLANLYAIKCGYGKEILKYYLEIVKIKDTNKFDMVLLMDFEHPKVEKMINVMLDQYNDDDLNHGFITDGDTLVACFNKETKVVLPNHIKVIGDKAFYLNQNIESLACPNVTTCNKYAGYYLNKLKHLIIPNLVSAPLNLLIGMPDLEDVTVLNQVGYDLIGQMYERINKFKEAIIWYEKGHEVKFIQAMLHLATLYTKMNIDKDEILYYELINMNYQDALIILFNLLFKRNKFEEAIKLVGAYQDLISDVNLKIYYQIGVYYYTGIYITKDLDKAIYYLNKASNVDEAKQLLEQIQTDLIEEE